MTLVDELMDEARGELKAAQAYRNLAGRLRQAGHLNEASMVDHIAGDEDKHAHSLMEMVYSIREATEPGGAFGTPPTGAVKETLDRISQSLTTDRPVPQTYGDWVDMAEDIKEKSGNDPAYNATINYQLNTISGEGIRETPEAVANAKRWLIEKAGELGIR